MRVSYLSDHVAASIEEVPYHLGEDVACGNVAAAMKRIMPCPGPFCLPG
jgi:hypothetical protein